jgi:hypothetical protein
MSSSEVETSSRRGLWTESMVFVGVAAFFFLTAIVYGFWSKEPAGTVALALTGGLGLIIGSFLWFTARRLDRARPEDDVDAEVADGAGDMGFFSPHSYWPFAMAAAGALTAVAVAFWLVWLLVIGAGFLLMTIMGLLFEYQRRYASH